MTPTRANVSDAGYDLYSVEEGLILSGTRKLIKTGVSIAIPPGYYGRVAPRSGPVSPRLRPRSIRMAILCPSIV